MDLHHILNHSEDEDMDSSEDETDLREDEDMHNYEVKIGASTIAGQSHVPHKHALWVATNYAQLHQPNLTGRTHSIPCQEHPYQTATVFPHGNPSPASSVCRDDPAVSPSIEHGSDQTPRVRGERGPNSNVRYDDAEVDLIRYCREDCNMKWEPTREYLNHWYPEHMRGGTKDKKSDQGPQGRWYRAQLVPVNGKLLQIGIRARKQPWVEALGLVHSFLRRDPEKALKSKWVSSAHKEEARKLRG